MAKSKKTKETPPQRPAQATQTPKVKSTNDNKPILWLLSLIGLAVLTFLAYRGGFQNEFIDWDDHVYIENNYLVTQPSWQSVKEAFRSSVALNYHPLTIISYIWNAAVWGSQDATPFIVTNVVIHLLNVWLVFYFIKQITSRNYFVSLVVAVLFAIHPMRVESVIWTSERKDVLYGFFFLLGLISYLRYLDQAERKWFIISFVCFVLSCLSKAQAVVFPVVLLLLDYWKNRPLSTKLLLEKSAFWVVAVGFGLIALSIQAGGNFYGLTQTVGVQKSALDLKVFSATDRLIYAGYGFMMYLVHLFYPLNLSGFYPYQENTPEANRYWMGLVVFGLTAAATVLSLRRTKLFGFGIGFYFVTVLLVLQFISVGAAIMADRYTYLPYLGLFFVLAMLLDQLARISASSKYLAWGLAVGFSAFCFYQTTQQVKVWHDSGTFFGQIIKNYPTDHRAYTTRGRFMGLQGKLDEAIADLENAIKYGNVESPTYDNLGTGYGMKGRTADAIRMFSKAIELGPVDGNPYRNRGLAYLSSEPLKAISDFEKALTMKLDDAVPTRSLLATALFQTGQYPKALANMNIVLDQSGTVGQTGENYYKRGIIKSQMMDRDGAVADLKKGAAMGYQAANDQLKAMGL
jgi:tetratricopeptide (TPR) repeat protein